MFGSGHHHHHHNGHHHNHHHHGHHHNHHHHGHHHHHHGHHHHHHGHHHHHHHGDGQQQPPLLPPQYGTFQGVANYPVIGFPQPVPPPGYAVVDGRPVTREHRLPCCGIGIGWFLFIIGFLLGAVPWYLGAFVLLCARIDHREKPGYVACMIAAILATFALVFGLTRNDW